MDLPPFCFVENMDLEIEKIIREAADMDDRIGFVALLKNQYALQLEESNELEKDVPENTITPRYCPPNVYELICLYEAVNCTKALLEGDPFVVNPNVPFKFGLYPLHIAAEVFSYDMVDLLLSHGARTDVRTINGEYRGDLLPLNVALEMLSYHRYLFRWTLKQSIFKLVVVLSLPQMRVPLETTMLLAWNTKDVNDILCKYATEGELIPMAALLMVAYKKIMAPSLQQSKDSVGLEGAMIRECILKEFTLICRGFELMSYENCDQGVLYRMKALPSALQLLDVFEKAGDAIEGYRLGAQYNTPKEKVGKDIKRLLEESGVVLEDKDIDLSDIDCESDDIKLATEVLEKRTSFRPHQYLCSPLHSEAYSVCRTSRPITDKRNEKMWAMSKFIEWGSPVLAHERIYKNCKLMEGNCVGFPFYRLPVNKSTGTVMKIPPAFFLNLDHYASFGLAIKRALTRIV